MEEQPPPSYQPPAWALGGERRYPWLLIDESDELGLILDGLKRYRRARRRLRRLIRPWDDQKYYRELGLAAQRFEMASAELRRQINHFNGPR